MGYIAQSIPWKVAYALLSYETRIPKDGSIFTEYDLALGLDTQNNFYFCLMNHGMTPDMIVGATPFMLVDDLTASPQQKDKIDFTSLSIISGVVIRAILSALTEYLKQYQPLITGTVGWRLSEAEVVVMITPSAENESDQRVVGSPSSIQREVHYFVETNTFTIRRRTFAR